MGSRCINSILASMRMCCSQLKSDIFINNISIDKFCICGEEETVFHYFFECCNYTNLRNTFLNETLSIANLSVLKILHGDESLSIRDNMKLNDAVSKFIIFWLVVFNVPSTSRSFRDGNYCPLRRT